MSGGEGGPPLRRNRGYRPAPLQDEDVRELQVQEAFLSERCGEPIILIAYRKAPTAQSVRSVPPVRRRRRA